MIKSILVIFPLIVAALGAGELKIFDAPGSISLKKVEKMDGEYLSEAMRAFMGFSISKSVPLKAQINDPFGLAEHLCLINVFGIPTMEPQNLKPKSEIQLTGYTFTIDSLIDAVQENNLEFVHVNLDDLEDTLPTLQAVCKTPLKIANAKIASNVKVDKEFIEKIATISALTEAIPNCELPTVLQIDVDFRNMDLKTRDEVMPLFTTAVEQLSQAYSKHTNEKAIFATLTTESQPIKRTRRDVPEEKDNLNLAPAYSENYPVIFNIILWFGVVLAFSLLAISYAIATMDPGRDSIIYRMTSTRIKKDN